ncbi:MAG: monovalent cation/H+ antiporter subunit D family protein, partial [Gammaproteobacteria bacterium]
MNSSWLLVFILLSSLVPGVIIFFLREDSRSLRTAFNLGGASLKLILVGALLLGVQRGEVYE